MNKKYTGNIKDYIGKRIGERTILGSLGQNKNGHTIVRCRCDCGREDDVELTILMNGKADHCRSCGNRKGHVTKKHLAELKQVEQKKADGLRSTNKSGYNGVFKNNREKKWVGQVKVKGETYYLGAYKTQKEALSVVNGFIIANKLPQSIYKIQKYRGEIESIEKE